MEGCDDFNGELSGAKICVSSSLAVNFLDHKLWQGSFHLSVELLAGLIVWCGRGESVLLLLFNSLQAQPEDRC